MNKVRLIQLRLALAAGALMLLSPGRMGAQAPPSTQASSPQPSPIASATPTAPPALGTAEAERVVVTAEKREQNIQEVPASISVINDVELDNLHATQLTFRGVSSLWSEVESSPTAIRTPAYGAMDLSADFSNGRWTVRVYAKNVWDERAYPTVFLNTNALTGDVVDALGTPIQPRTVGVEVDCKF